MSSATIISDSRARATAAGTTGAVALPPAARDAAPTEAPATVASVAMPVAAVSCAVTAAISPPGATAALSPPAVAVRPPVPAPMAATALYPGVAADLANIRNLYDAGSFDDALTRVTAARTLYPNHLEVAAEHCKVAITAGCYTAALAAAGQVLANPEADEVQRSLAQETRARALLNLGNYAEARRLCETEIGNRATVTALCAVAALHDSEQGYGDLLGILQNQPATQGCEMAVAAAYVAAKQRANAAANQPRSQRIAQADAAAVLNYAEAQGHARKPVWRSAVAVADFLFGSDVEREAARRLLRTDANLAANPLAALVRLLPALQPNASEREMTEALRHVVTLLNTERKWVPAHAVRVALLMRIGTSEQRGAAMDTLRHRFGDSPDNLAVVSLIACLHDRNRDWAKMLETLNAGLAAHVRAAGDTVAQASELDEQLLRAHTKLENWEAVETLVDRLRQTLVEALQNTEETISPTLCVVVGDSAMQLGGHHEILGNKLRAKQLYNWAQDALIASLDGAPGSAALMLRAAQACVDHGRLANPADASDIYLVGLQELDNLAEDVLGQSQLHDKKMVEARLFLGLQRYDECRATLRLLNGTSLQKDAERIAGIAQSASEAGERFANIETMYRSLEMRGEQNPLFHQIITECTGHLRRHRDAPEYLAARGIAYLRQGRLKKALDDLRLAKVGLPAEDELHSRVVCYEQEATVKWSNKNVFGRSGTCVYDFACDRPYATAGIAIGIVGVAVGANVVLTGGGVVASAAGVFRAAFCGVAAGATAFTRGARC